MLMQICSRSDESIGEDIESIKGIYSAFQTKKSPEITKCSGPSNVTNLSYNGILLFVRSLIFVFL